MRRLVATAQARGIDPASLLSVYCFESGLDPSAVNPGSSAQGAAQFLPSTLAALGYPGDPLAFHTLSLAEQWPWMEKLLDSQIVQFGSTPPTAAVILHLQLAPSRARTSVVYSAGEPGYAANARMDRAGKGYIDREDLRAALAASDASATYQAALWQLRRMGG